MSETDVLTDAQEAAAVQLQRRGYLRCSVAGVDYLMQVCAGGQRFIGRAGWISEWQSLIETKDDHHDWP